LPLHLFGIRHHGPGSARAVVRALDEVVPDVVLVELPAEATAALRWVTGPHPLAPPVALLGHLVDEPRRAVFAPLAVFSPEWQAVTWANHRGVPVEAIDLPLAMSLHPGSDPGCYGGPVDPLAALAAAAGEPDPERWWEDVIEHREGGTAAFVAVAEAMAAVRAGTVAPVGEARREAHMRRAIRAALKAHSTVAVVCGAWHVPMLDVIASGTPPAADDAATLRGLPRAKVAVSWVPWTHARLAAAGGYGAGVVSPGWYAHVFHHPGPDGVARFFVDAARVLRGADLPASPDHLIAATRIADALAALRGRPRPGLAEVLDAADTVMGGLPLVHRRLVVGEAIGAVPPGAPQVPLARDLERRRKTARLTMSDEPHVVELDLRTPNGLRRSHLLHQLTALGVGWGVIEEGRGSSGTFRETWRLRWQPELSVRLVEHAGYGVTVEQAATARLVERAHQAAGIVQVAGALDQALLADLAAAVDPVVDVLARRAATDPDLAQLMAALGPLAGAQRYGDVRGTSREAIRGVFDGLVVRVLAGLVPACAALDEQAAAAMVERISETQHALALIDHPARRAAFPRVLAQLAGATRQSPGSGMIAGRATRVLHDGGHWSPLDVGQRLGQALSGGTPPAVGAAFVEGFLAGSGTVLVHDAGLRAIVDGWLAALTPQAFDVTVPLLRRTFGGFEPAERRQLGRLVAGTPVHEPAAWGPGVDPDRLALVLTTVRHMLGLPTGAS
jgi:hypothetical protein